MTKIKKENLAEEFIRLLETLKIFSQISDEKIDINVRKSLERELALKTEKTTHRETVDRILDLSDDFFNLDEDERSKVNCWLAENIVTFNQKDMNFLYERFMS